VVQIFRALQEYQFVSLTLVRKAPGIPDCHALKYEKFLLPQMDSERLVQTNALLKRYVIN
jgi:hypothetical protein